MNITEAYLRVSQSPEDTLVFLNMFRKMVRNELARRGAPFGLEPVYFGIEVPTWSDWNTQSYESEGPLTDFTTDCFVWLFERNSELREAADSGEIGGLIRHKIRHFIFDRQKSNDPIGHRTYSISRKVCETLIASGDLKCLDNPGRIARDTRIGFNESGNRLDAKSIEELIRKHSDTPKVALFLATKPVSTASQLFNQNLLSHKDSLPVFFFGDYVKPWSRHARNASKAQFQTENPVQILLSEDGEESIDIVQDDRGFLEKEEALDVIRFIAYLRQEVNQEKFQKRVHVRLVAFLNILPGLLDEDPLPSDAEVARRLDVSTSTFGEDKARLRELMEKFIMKTEIQKVGHS